MKKIILFGLIFLSRFGFAQEIKALNISSKIQIDGFLTEEAWSKAVAIKDSFVTLRPIAGKIASQRTEIKMMYDDVSVYFAAICYDHPDSISKVFSVRDDYNPNLDIFSIFLDTYNDHQNGFYFGVTSQGVQLDAKLIQGDFNDQLNLVWGSKVQKNDSAWVVEIKLPYSAFRFPKQEIQLWNVNFARQIARNREEACWVPVNPDFENYLINSGKVLDVQNIDPPLRLGLIPYVSSYVNIDNVGNSSRSFYGGMDIKYGINEAFTLDVTLVPDFGQVIFDNQVLNTTPFEIQFNENRQFFTEGMELFNKSGIFYSRRIGIQAPWDVLTSNLQENEVISSLPGNAQLYNASKFSGRTKKGLGLGVFNAVSAPLYATALNTITDEIRSFLAAPLTNYNVVVLNQNIKNNGSITFTNSNVIRNGGFYDANVSAFNTNFNSKDNNYTLNTSANVSNKLYVDSLSTGYNFGIGGGKQRGNFILTGNYFEENDTYDPNDLGYNQVNNRRIAGINVAYRHFKPWWVFNKWSTNATIIYNRLYNPNEYTSSNIDLGFFAVTKKFFAFGLNGYSAFTETHDYFEPREWGQVYVYPRWTGGGGWMSTNYQKALALDLKTFYTIFEDAKDWNLWNYNVGIRWRISNKMLLSYSFDYEEQINDKGYAYHFGEPVDVFDGILFGKKNRKNYINTIDYNFTITNRMNLSMRTRHYRSNLEYKSFYLLNEDGSLEPINTLGLDASGVSAFNVNYNAFTIDFIYRWVFLPGSELSLVWKNSIYTSNKDVSATYFQSIQETLKEGPANNFSIKLLYWLDTQNFKNRNPKPSEK